MTINEQTTKQFNSASQVLNNTNEFKNNFNLISLNVKGIVFADKDFNNHYLLPRANKKSLYNFNSEKIELIKSFN
jgi:hypothetical protein